MSDEFLQYSPTLDNYWRSIILFGRNVASYKFALAKSLLEFRERGNDLITLEELAEPFSRNLCSHLAAAPNHPDLADVDHFFPWKLKEHGVAHPVDGVWNLVLACKGCNRGRGGKSARVPSIKLLYRLKKRNDFLINSHHPLRETLIAQTGGSEAVRKSFLQKTYNEAKAILIHEWDPEMTTGQVF